VFERFTDRARQAIVLAQDEARALKHNYIGTEHLLLGLLRDENSTAGKVLASLGIRLEEVRGQVGRIVGQGEEAAIGQIPFTPRGKKVLELSLREALSLQHDYIGPEHILLGLARENEGVAARILLDFGVDAERIRSAVGEKLGVEVPARPPKRDKAPHGWPAFGMFDVPVGTGPQPPPVFHYGRGRYPALLLGWLLFAVALGIGVLLGWLIWG